MFLQKNKMCSLDLAKGHKYGASFEDFIHYSVTTHLQDRLVNHSIPMGWPGQDVTQGQFLGHLS